MPLFVLNRLTKSRTNECNRVFIGTRSSLPPENQQNFHILSEKRRRKKRPHIFLNKSATFSGFRVREKISDKVPLTSRKIQIRQFSRRINIRCDSKAKIKQKTAMQLRFVNSSRNESVRSFRNRIKLQFFRYTINSLWTYRIVKLCTRWYCAHISWVTRALYRSYQNPTNP